MVIELHRDKHHLCLLFSDETPDRHEAVPSNQFLVVNRDTGAIIDPGGNMAYNELYVGMMKYFPPPRSWRPSWPRTPTRTSSRRSTAG